ncbi:MAG: 2-octaprenyl-6-methoxyphenyl hydroxylase [Rhodobacteraceae bacterium GWE1_64_9]|nr:MAG: 2-octaprenyl-6-methoxyphenyl hydroxylase [Rhodobacteraceae bacterium GWE1_64_9]OHC48078.1 MAG: 2-octaprenyl-6-methoxyphenyl hydroxylase [Rhodobacteraceae bacterium GWF1_65_7]HBD90074.1 UbiH/UbiF family hydroxylase [Gemmobacter sp.]HBU14648.1 UbiH/UbiF family hydroxylase [Gemmobacter sp.]
MRDTTDILISGGGIAGLAAACAFGAAGFRVICVEPDPPVTEARATGSDLRTTAFLHPSIPVLEAAGLWARLAPHAAALQIMRIVDAGGPVAEPRVIKDFNAADLSDKPFGWNLPNWLLRREMLARMAELPDVTFLPGLATTAVLTRSTEALVTLSDGRRIAARLLIGADGRGSMVRQALGIKVRTLRYGQKALAFATSHPIPHDNVSTEIHRSGGPFTFVPLPDRDGRPCSAVVWMDHAAEVDRRLTLPAAEFEAEMMDRSCGLLGPLKLESRLTAWPIIAQIAERMAGERTALMAEAAHVMPPIGAQGLNMSLADLTALLDLAMADRAGLGSPAMLDAYHRKRHLDVQTRVMGIDLLNRASQIGAQPLRDMRATALDALYSVAPVRRGLMRAGIGVR